MSHHLAFVLQARRADRSDSVAGDSHEFVTAHLRGEILFDDGESGLLFLDEIRTIAGTERIDTLVPSPRFARQHFDDFALRQGGVHPGLLIVSTLGEEDTNNEKPACVLLPERKLQVIPEFFLQAHGTS